MFLFPHRPFLNAAFRCISVCLLFPVVAAAQSTGPVVVNEPLLSLTGGQQFAVSNFDPTLGTLTDVSLVLTEGRKTVTIFDTNNASDDWVDLTFGGPGATNVNANALSAWGNSLGNVDLTYRKATNKSVESMGDAGLLLFCTPRNGAIPYLSIDYTYDIGNGNNNNATPEPGAKYLAAIAAGMMTLMLLGRSLRRRGDPRGEMAALAPA